MARRKGCGVGPQYPRSASPDKANEVSKIAGRKITTAKKTRFWPESVRLFARRRLFELIGFSLLLVAGAIAGAIVSYNPTDASGNVAGGSVVNGLGIAGAFVADVLVQTLGYAGWLIIVVLLAWSWRMLSHRGLPHLWRHLALLPLLLLSAGLFAATLAGGDSPAIVQAGGVIGLFLAEGTHRLLSLAGIAGQGWVAALLAGLLTLVFAVFTLGLERREAMVFAGALGRLLQRLGRVLTGAARSLGGLAGNIFEGRRRSATTGRMPVRKARAKAAPKESKTSRESRVTPPRGRLASGKRAAAERQPTLDLEPGGAFKLPPLNLLGKPPRAERGTRIREDALEQSARMLETVLDDFGVNGEILKVHPGPVVTLYELEPAPGTKSSRVVGLADDIARSMSAVSARVAVIPGRNAIGIELPNAHRETVYLRELLAARAFEQAHTSLALALGKDIGGQPVIVDLSAMPHLLIAGTTGSGKSVAINTMIMSLIYRLRPDQCKFIMIDPKMLELSVYDGIPHLMTPVVTDSRKAIVALKWAVREMEERYRSMSKLGVRSLSAYNKRVREALAKGEEIKRTVQTGYDQESGKPVYEQQLLDLMVLPLIVIVVDEMADLMMVAGKDVEASIQRLAQMARAAGIHLIMATQRPSVDVITGTIKANFPTRVSFQVTSKIDSRTILGEQGAEQLLGQGDMLYMAGGGRITRVHGAFVTDDEVETVVHHLKAQGAPQYIDDVTVEIEDDPLSISQPLSSGDELYDQAVELVARERRASTSFVQRHLQIGYNRAARIIERMEKEGVIGAANHVGKREILVLDHSDR